jgi:hypothetical protein
VGLRAAFQTGYEVTVWNEKRGARSSPRIMGHPCSRSSPARAPLQEYEVMLADSHSSAILACTSPAAPQVIAQRVMIRVKDGDVLCVNNTCFFDYVL